MIFSLPFFNFQHMHFCEYIAENNQVEVQQLCDNYQMPCETQEEAANSLVALAAMDNKTLKEVMEIHPDRDIIVELFGNGGSGGKGSFHNASGCGCDKCKKLDKMQHWIRQADGGTSTMGGSFPHDLFSGMPSNTLLILGIVGAFTLALVVAKH